MQTFEQQLEAYKQLEFSHYKLKVSGNLALDKLKINALRNSNKKITFRLDANNLWSSSKEACDYINALNFPFWVIEEPFNVGNYSACVRLNQQLDIPILLDESFMRYEQWRVLQQIELFEQKKYG